MSCRSNTRFATIVILFTVVSTALGDQDSEHKGKVPRPPSTTNELVTPSIRPATVSMEVTDETPTASEDSVSTSSVVPEVTYEPAYHDIGCRLAGFSSGSGLFARTWLSQGFTWNPDAPTNNFNVPVTFNDRANEYQMNQLYVSLGREVYKQGYSWDIGAQVDILYGTDYFFTTATGLETRQDGSPKWNSGNGPRGTGASLYGFAMPQVFAEVFAPIGNGLSVKLGHFYTIMGYESVMAPENFFYSHAYTKQYGEPFTHTGLLADYDVSNELAFQAGFTRGWDTWEDPAGTLAFLGGVNWTSIDGCTSLAFSLHTGDEDADGDNRTAYSLVCTRELGCRIRYVFQHDLGVEENAAVGPGGPKNAMWYGINQYLLYEMDDTLAAGLRMEWFRDEDNARVLGIPVSTVTSGGNYFGLTAGLNWKPRPKVTFRPEVRWDHSDVAGPPAFSRNMFNDFTETGQLTIAADLIIEL